MQSALTVSSLPARCTVHRSAPKRAAVKVAAVKVVATAAYESDWEDAAADAASGIIGGEWATNPWSLGLAVARPGSQRSQRGSVVARSSASEEGVDTAQVLGGEWDARSMSLVSYDDLPKPSTHSQQGRH